MLWQTTTDCSINRFQGHHCYYKPCSLIYNNTNMFYKRAVQCSVKINHFLPTHSWLSTAHSPAVNWIPSHFVLFTLRSTRNGLEEDGERKDSLPELGMHIHVGLVRRYVICPVCSSTTEFFSLVFLVSHSLPFLPCYPRAIRRWHLLPKAFTVIPQKPQQTRGSDIYSYHKLLCSAELWVQHTAADSITCGVIWPLLTLGKGIDTKLGSFASGASQECTQG